MPRLLVRRVRRSLPTRPRRPRASSRVATRQTLPVPGTIGGTRRRRRGRPRTPRRRCRTASRAGTAGTRGPGAGGTAAGATSRSGASRPAWRSAVAQSDGCAMTSADGPRPEANRCHRPPTVCGRSEPRHGGRGRRAGRRPNRCLAGPHRPSRRAARSSGRGTRRGAAGHPASRRRLRTAVRGLVGERRAGDPGQARAGPPRARLPLRRGPPPHRGRSRRRQDVARQGDRPLDRRDVAPHPVHARPPAVRRHRRVGLEPGARAEFEFRPGGVFANVVLADEINRASPKTQSALLEAMEERQVTVDAHTYRLARRSS